MRRFVSELIILGCIPWIIFSAVWTAISAIAAVGQVHQNRKGKKSPPPWGTEWVENFALLMIAPPIVGLATIVEPKKMFEKMLKRKKKVKKSS